MKRTFEILISICLLLSLNIALCGCTDMIIETGSPIYHHVYVDRYPVYIHPTPPPSHYKPMPGVYSKPRPMFVPNNSPIHNNRRGHFGNGRRR